MIKRTASFTNMDDNVQLIVDGNTDGIVIDTIEGIYAFDGEVATTPYAQTSGDRYKSSRTVKRNIVVSGTIYKNYWTNRQMMYRVFRIGAQGQFGYEEPGRDTRLANYYVESIGIDQNAYRGVFQISLICPDPFFYLEQPEVFDLATWTKDFEFIHEFVASGEELGHRENSFIHEVINENGVDGIGMKIVFSANGNVTNPYVYLYETGEQITVGTESNPFVLTSNSTVEIDTTTGKKNAVHIVNGVETRINNRLDPASEFFQLRAGLNTIGYNAESGVEYLNVHVEYRMRFLGV